MRALWATHDALVWRNPMGREVKVRLSYQADVGFLTRLSRAVELDKKMPKGRKQKCMAAINALQSEFLAESRDRLSGRAV